MNSREEIKEYIFNTYFKTQSDERLLAVFNNYFSYQVTDSDEMNLDIYIEFLLPQDVWLWEFLAVLNPTHYGFVNNKNIYLSLTKIYSSSNRFSNFYGNPLFHSNYEMLNLSVTNELKGNYETIKFDSIFSQPLGISIVLANDLKLKRSLISSFTNQLFKTHPAIILFAKNYLEVIKKKIENDSYNEDFLLSDIFRFNTSINQTDFVGAASAIEYCKTKATNTIETELKKYNEKSFSYFHQNVFTYKNGFLYVKGDKHSYRVHQDLFISVEALLKYQLSNSKPVKFNQILDRKRRIRDIDSITKSKDGIAFKNKYLKKTGKHFWKLDGLKYLS